ncbi:hypothetical protein Pmani_012716 [Petrolisthes manimaculis]|uniref:Uncharacterized protein n=1 Tax=Petrolisthes manimaculis TaxID=1843537 RepID=A0AAE1PZV4_9EUCA|nr:hypothetical protein Pmani_012716 [Petrolisthes manimaculis]
MDKIPLPPHLHRLGCKLALRSGLPAAALHSRDPINIGSLLHSSRQQHGGCLHRDVTQISCESVTSNQFHDQSLDAPNPDKHETSGFWPHKATNTIYPQTHHIRETHTVLPPA